VTIVFGLFSALLALVAMRALGTPELDSVAYLVGIISAGLIGMATIAALQWLRDKPRFRGVAWTIVPFAGGVVGMIVQAVLCARAPADRPILLSTGLTTYDPVRWILCGMPMGGTAALVAAGVLATALRVVAPAGNHDARERMTVPFAGACGLLAAGALAGAKLIEIPALIIVLLLAVGALVQVLVSDRARTRWLERIFAGEDASFEIVPLADCPGASDLPAAVGAVFPRAAIVRIEDDVAYRGAARTPFASTAATRHEAVLPLLRRRLMLVALLATTGIGASIALIARATGAMD
jgi:hypothetical protein